jgi:hypothetical protein
MKVHVNASITATGDAKGRFSIDIFDLANGTASASGQVSCVAATGTTAIVQGVIDTTNDPFLPEGLPVYLKFVDNGSGVKDPPDQMGVFQGSANCLDLAAAQPTTAGNIKVFDGA